MPVLYYWDGANWRPITSGSGGTGGGVGPQGPPGQSVEVFGPQTVAPMPNRKGDIWLSDEVAIVRSVPEDDKITVATLEPRPDTPVVPLRNNDPVVSTLVR